MFKYYCKKNKKQKKQAVRPRLLLVIMALLLSLPLQNVYAACTDPTGVTGEMVYNADENVPQVCTGSGWVALGILDPTAGSGGCTNPTGIEGESVYNADVSKPQYCNGEDWVVMTGAMSGSLSCSGPADCPDIGDQCTDTTIFAGCHPVTYNKLFLHPNNQSAASMWSSEYVVTSVLDYDNGKNNQDWIVANKTLTTYPAFKLCDDLNGASALGHTDWYLPSINEMYYFWTVRAAINAGPGDSFATAWYFSSTESGIDGSNIISFATGDPGYVDNYWKDDSYDVRCMRRE